MTSTAHARAEDPYTSHLAAATVADITRSQATILAIYHQLGDLTDGDLIAYYMEMVDAGDYPPLSVSGIRTRRSELVALRRLADTGKRALTLTGRRCIVWGLPA